MYYEVEKRIVYDTEEEALEQFEAAKLQHSALNKFQPSSLRVIRKDHDEVHRFGCVVLKEYDIESGIEREIEPIVISKVLGV